MQRNYHIALATLGISILDPAYSDYHWTDFSCLSNERLAYNMENLYAWNLRGSYGFESDGPCVFIRY